MKVVQKIILIGILFLATASHARIEDFHIEVERIPGSNPILQMNFRSVRGIKYDLWQSNDLKDWQNTDQSRVGDGSNQGFNVTAPASNPAQFYRVEGQMNDTILSGITNVDYPVHIYVPNDYHTSTDPYPVIYATDGQWNFNGFASAIEERNLQVILVAIEQGPDDRRLTDYSLIGAEDYFTFIKNELIPAVESIYRIDHNERTLCGTSLGGLLVGLVLLMEDLDAPHFKNYLSFDGSFWFNRSEIALMEQQRFESSQVMNATLFLSSALKGQTNDFWVTHIQLMLEYREYSGLNIIRRSYDVIHNDVAQPSFEEALDLLF